MKLPAPSEYPKAIRDLTARLRRLETLLGTPAAYPNLDDEVVRVAHRLRNELTVFELSCHPCVPQAGTDKARARAFVACGPAEN